MQIFFRKRAKYQKYKLIQDHTNLKFEVSDEDVKSTKQWRFQMNKLVEMSNKQISGDAK